MAAKKKRASCNICFDCGWIINDSEQSPFANITFEELMPGDELIRCPGCNDIKIIKVKKRQSKNGKRSKNWSTPS